MAATFTTTITSIRTGTVGNLTDVIKRVEFIIKGTEAGQAFELPLSLEIADPDPAVFIQLPNVAEADVVRWVDENFTNKEGVQAHIQQVLTTLAAEAAFESKPMPWTPPAEVPEAP